MGKKIWVTDKKRAEAGFAISHLGIVEMTASLKILT